MKTRSAIDAQLAELVWSKTGFRRRQARLPYARKVEIVVRLQELAIAIGKAAGRRPDRKAWKIREN